MSISWIVIYSVFSQLALIKFLPMLSFITPIFALSWSIKKLTTPSLLSLAFFLGVFFDLFSSGLPVGSHPLIFILSSLIIKRFHHYFYDDKLITIILISLLFSIFTNVFTLIAHFFNSQLFQVNSLFIISEIVAPALFDCAFCAASTLLLKGLNPLWQWGSKKFRKRFNLRAAS